MNPKISSDKELRFDSNFESGNLDYVIKRKPDEYDMYMRVDTNTRGHHQWFYYSITFDNMAFFADRTVRFNLMNFTKSSSLY